MEKVFLCLRGETETVNQEAPPSSTVPCKKHLKINRS